MSISQSRRFLKVSAMAPEVATVDWDAYLGAPMLAPMFS